MKMYEVDGLAYWYPDTVNAEKIYEELGASQVIAFSNNKRLFDIEATLEIMRRLLIDVLSDDIDTGDGAVRLAKGIEKFVDFDWAADLGVMNPIKYYVQTLNLYGFYSLLPKKITTRNAVKKIVGDVIAACELVDPQKGNK